jgi:hypothetical protein
MVGLTAAISCEAHIDDAKAIVKHLQLRRFVSFIALFDRSCMVRGNTIRRVDRR